jgi:hypothetical protein
MTTLILLLLANSAFAETQCDEWANFSKIIAYRMRDGVADIPPQKLQDVVLKVKEQNLPDVDKAIVWVNYVYAHPNVSPIQIWKDVYQACIARPTL